MTGELPIMTLQEAARRLGIKPDTLRHQAQDDHGRLGQQGALARRLNARKIGRDWMVDRDAVETEIARRS